MLIGLPVIFGCETTDTNWDGQIDISHWDYAVTAIIEGKHFAGEPEDGIQFLGQEDSHILVKDCTFTDCGDELASVVKGATDITFENCYFYDNDKGVLVGTGRAVDYESECDVVVRFVDCVFDGVSRRHPFLRYGTLYMIDCEIRNWYGGYKTHGIKLESGATAYLKNVHFHQDRFYFEPLNWLRGGGCWKGIKTDGTCKIYKKNLTKNKWWIKI